MPPSVGWQAATGVRPTIHYPLMLTLRRTLLWLLRNRNTGRLTVVQWPNIPLAAYLLATIIHIVFRSSTAVSTVVAAVASAALAIWAVL
jgi:hypothetical protein